jgi:hypothetical protein
VYEKFTDDLETLTESLKDLDEFRLVENVFMLCGLVAESAISKKDDENNLKKINDILDSAYRVLRKVVSYYEERNDIKNKIPNALSIYVNSLIYHINTMHHVKDQVIELETKKFVEVYKNSNKLAHEFINHVYEWGEVLAIREILGRNLSLNLYITEEIDLNEAKRMVDIIFSWLPFFSKYKIKRFKIKEDKPLVNDVIECFDVCLDEKDIAVIVTSKDVYKPAFDKDMKQTHVLCPGYSPFDRNIAFCMYLGTDTTAKIAIHEIAHIFGLEHCENERCLMHVEYKETNDKNEMIERLKKIYATKTTFCDDCYTTIEIKNILR